MDRSQPAGQVIDGLNQPDNQGVVRNVPNRRFRGFQLRFTDDRPVHFDPFTYSPAIVWSLPPRSWHAKSAPSRSEPSSNWNLFTADRDTVAIVDKIPSSQFYDRRQSDNQRQDTG